MKQRNTSFFDHFLDEERTQNIYEIFRMLRMKASENKHTHMSMIFYLLFLFVLLSSGCSRESGEKEREETSPLVECENKLLFLKNVDDADRNLIVREIKEWQKLNNNSLQYLMNEEQNDSLFSVYYTISDSVKSEFKRIGKLIDCSLFDLAYIKLNTSNFIADSTMMSEINNANKFYADLKKSTLKDAEPETLMKVYSQFLKDFIIKDIKDEKDMINFLYSEDVLFNTFLDGLNRYWKQDFSEITTLTETCCTKIYKAAHNDLIKDETALAYMSMRTNRRLIQNARSAERLLQRGIIKDSGQAQTYLLMIMQPFIFNDHLASYTMTDEQKQFLLKLAGKIPEISDRLIKHNLIDAQLIRSLPNSMLQNYLSTI